LFWPFSAGFKSSWGPLAENHCSMGFVVVDILVFNEHQIHGTHMMLPQGTKKYSITMMNLRKIMTDYLILNTMFARLICKV